MKPLTAFHNWQTALAQLENALDTFFDACTALQLTCSEADAEVEGVVERLFNRLDQLDKMRQKMATSRAITLQTRNDSAAVVPIAGLPAELLAEVFAYCVDPRSRGREIYRELCPHPLNTITGVCSRWRRIALSTPSLWPLVIVDYDAPRQHTSPIPIRTQLWLDRSASMPLTLYVNSIFEEYNIQQIVPVLRPYLPRVTHLAFHSMHNSFVDELLLAQGDISFVALSALSLSDVEGDSTRFRDPGPTIWPTIHGLQELELTDLGWDICPQPEELAMVLARCPNLQTLRIRLENSLRFSTSENRPVICLPALRRLAIGPLENVGLRDLLSILQPDLPNLNVMLELPSREDDEAVLPIKTFLQRSNVTVLKLRSSMTGLCSGFEHYLDSLSRCHTLTLEFPEHEISFNAHYKSTKLPELRVLNISGVYVGSSASMEIVKISEMCSLDRIAFSKSVFFARTKLAEAETRKCLSQLPQRAGEVVFEADDFED